MIKDYKHIELYTESTMRLISNKINKSSTNIFNNFISETGTKTSTVTLNRMLSDVKMKKSLYSRQVKSLEFFTQHLSSHKKSVDLKLVKTLNML